MGSSKRTGIGGRGSECGAIADCKLQIANCKSKSRVVLSNRPISDQQSFRLPASLFRLSLCLLVLPGSFAACSVARADGRLEARRRQIEAMTPAEKQQLLRLKEQFEKLDPAEQQRLRRLHEQLHNDPRADELRRTMHRYHQWLQTLSPLVRAELLELEPAERIKRIRKLRAEQAKSKRPDAKDTEVLLGWMEQYARKHAVRFLATLPEQQRQQVNRMPEQIRRRTLTSMMWQSGKGGKVPPPNEQDLAELRGKLSDSARKQLESKSPKQQWQTIGNWIRQASRRRFSGRHFKGPLPPLDEERLELFFENELTDRQRDHLLSLPGDEMQRTLRKLYLERKKPAASPHHRSSGWGHDSRHRMPSPPPSPRPSPHSGPRSSPRPGP